MTVYKKRDETVEAVKFEPGNAFALEKVRQFLHGCTYKIEDEILLLHVPHGTLTVMPGSYIIKENDEFYQMNSTTFEKKYEQSSST